MAMSILQIRVDESLKNEANDLFERLGKDIPTAVRIFFKRAIIEKRLPFYVSEIPSTTAQDNSRLMQALHALNDETRKRFAPLNFSFCIKHLFIQIVATILRKSPRLFIFSQKKPTITAGFENSF